MAVVSRELQITYGGYTVGGDTDYLIDSYHYVEKGYRASRMEFSFVITADDEETFATECAVAETSFRKINQTLIVTLKEKTLFLIGQKKGSAYDTVPRIYKPNDEAQTARSRLYHVEINCSMQANTGAERSSGLRDVDVALSYNEARRRSITVAGMYTSVGKSTAREQYDDVCDAFCQTVIDSFGGTFEILHETSSEDTYENELTFTRVYQEIIFEQGPSGLDDPEIVDQQLVISPQWVAPGDSPLASVERVININLGYQAWVDAEKTTNLTGKYKSLRSWLIAQAGRYSQASGLALMAETVTYNPDENSFTVSMQLQATGGSKYLQYRVTVSDTWQSGKVLVPIWDGEPLERYVYQGPAVALRTFMQDIIVKGKLSQPAAKGEMKSGLAALSDGFKVSGETAIEGGNWILMDERMEAQNLRRGLTGHQFDVTEILGVTTYQYYKGVKKGGTRASPASG